MYLFRTLFPLILSALVLLLTACNDKPSATGTTTKKPPPAHLVEIVTGQRELVSTSHERTGSLRARRLVRIYSQEEGRITHLPFFEGDHVQKGDLLLRLEDELLRAELAKAKATTSQARQDQSRIKNLVKRQAASEDELTRTGTALSVALAEQRLLETHLAYTRIKAPFEGVISARFAEPGDVVSKHRHILTLTDPQSLIIEIHVSELLLPHIEKGDRTEVHIDALVDQTFQGRILRIHPEIDPVTRQGVVEVMLDPVPNGARVGQFARVTLSTAQVERLLVPFATVRRDSDSEFVYRMDENNQVLRTPVRSGIRIADKIEILEGLEPGQPVISRGFLGLSVGKKVKPVNTPN